MGDQSTTNAGLGSAVAFAVLGTTCCALPVTLVALGAGGAVASLFSNLPWLVTLSQYKEITFAATAGALGFSFWRLRRVAACDVADAKRLVWQRRVLWAATGLLAVSLFAAYALLPLARWWDGA